MNSILREQKIQFQSLKFDASKLPEMELIELELLNSLAESKDVVREMCSHVISAGGKRIRPVMVMYSGLIFGDASQELLHAAVASELIHMASLVHDDIIDKSSVRRNKPSINHQWGNHFAVLCGDYLFARAFGVLAENRLIYSMDYMVEAIENMCQGEINQAGDKFNCSIGKDVYYKRIAQKTAIFLSCCCKSGAIVAGADSIQVDLIGEYGLNLGYAFQIIDDILDFYGDSHVMGKPCYEDLIEGNITLPIVLLLENEKYGPWVRSVIEHRELSPQNLEKIKNVLTSTGIMQQSFETASLHIEKAKNCLTLLPHNKYTEYLHSMADFMQGRRN